MHCYTDVSQTSNSSSSVSYPVLVTVGEKVYCRVNVTSDVWDDRLQLIVPNCSFTAEPHQTNHSYQFIVNKYVMSASIDCV